MANSLAGTEEHAESPKTGIVYRGNSPRGTGMLLRFPATASGPMKLTDASHLYRGSSFKPSSQGDLLVSCDSSTYC